MEAGAASAAHSWRQVLPDVEVFADSGNVYAVRGAGGGTIFVNSGSGRWLAAGPRAEVECELTMTPKGRCRRRPIVAELSIGEQHFGQFAEALVTVGNDIF